MYESTSLLQERLLASTKAICRYYKSKQYYCKATTTMSCQVANGTFDKNINIVASRYLASCLRSTHLIGAACLIPVLTHAVLRRQVYK